MNRVCRKCRAVIEDDTRKFCPSCGEVLDDELRFAMDMDKIVKESQNTGRPPERVIKKETPKPVRKVVDDDDEEITPSYQEPKKSNKWLIITIAVLAVICIGAYVYLTR